MRSAFVKLKSGEVVWICPGCGGDCFGSSMERYHCHGKGEEDPCSYFEDWGFCEGRRGAVNGVRIDVKRGSA